MSNEMKRIDLDKIEPNPFRDFIRNPQSEEHLAVLQLSIKNTGFWNGSIVRPHPDKPDHYQLMFGHARVEAARRFGITNAYFSVEDADDEKAIMLMTNENSTQNKEKHYAAVAESVRAAMGLISLNLLDSSHVPNFRGVENISPKALTELINDVRSGGNVGTETIQKFFGGTLYKNDIELAIQTMKDTGEIEAWHKTNNPNFKNDKPIEPTISYQAITGFTKPDHVRTFTSAVKQMKIPVSEQPALAEKVMASLVPPPKRSASGRENFQGNVDSDKRFNSANIRKVVVEAGLDRTRDDKRKERLAKIAMLTTIEKDLTDIEAGLTRANSGYIRLKKTVEIIGGIQPTDITGVVSIKLKNIAETIRELDRLLKTKDTRKLLQIGE